jgi:MFS family permease
VKAIPWLTKVIDPPIPVDRTIPRSHANSGMLVSLVFAMQAAGLIVGPLLAAALLATNLSHNLIWRILLAFGANSVGRRSSRSGLRLWLLRSAPSD